jgi:hypothetical protein
MSSQKITAEAKWARGAQVFAVDGVSVVTPPSGFAALGGEWSRRELRWEFPLTAQQQVLDLLKSEFDYVPAAPVAATRPAYKPFAQQTRRERLHTELASIRRPSYSDDDANGGNGSVLNDAARNSSLR